MKKLICILMALSLTLGLGACAAGNAEDLTAAVNPQNVEKLRIFPMATSS